MLHAYPSPVAISLTQVGPTFGKDVCVDIYFHRVLEIGFWEGSVAGNREEVSGLLPPAGYAGITGGCITVPQLLQVRSSSFAQKASITGFSCVVMSVSGKNAS